MNDKRGLYVLEDSVERRCVRVAPVARFNVSKLPLDAPHVLDASFLPGREVWCDRRWTESSTYGAQVPLMHVAPELVQSTHVPPVFPHAVSTVPGWQVPLNAAEQQPPLQGVRFGSLHAVVHM